jgi:hypothetical protein
MENPDEEIGNTNMTNREFSQWIKGVKTPKLKAKLALGTMLIKDLHKNEQDDPRTPEALKSLETQTAILTRELKRRERQLNDEEAAVEETEPEKPEPGPLDQVVGLKTLDLTGKADMG